MCQHERIVLQNPHITTTPLVPAISNLLFTPNELGSLQENALSTLLVSRCSFLVVVPIQVLKLHCLVCELFLTAFTVKTGVSG